MRTSSFRKQYKTFADFAQLPTIIKVHFYLSGKLLTTSFFYLHR